ncbi:alpha/beta hydrolase-fold protein [Microbulbifer sp. OS29]|uniref:Alpha/beta hydrolase-fold protein n=1 Tax=Microbulbifer okhotskensis TaxID=2926617 RepID=A0A9X2EIE8_9GAMM|nr:alpha/beta hydrolase-fold protein [Microbulbifer okhotskensis]MCO1332812.1 alpha/beta hydrolase-fold protein [Microbulbifer okhotskensis]
MKYLVPKVKPCIDNNLAVSNVANNTFIAGASMGGLIPLYAVTEYPEAFFTVAAISTHWPGINPDDKLPISWALCTFLRENLPEPGNYRFYYDHDIEMLYAYYPPLQ